MNMKVIRRSRKRSIPGDIFVLQVRKGEYFFGRVISTKANVGGFKNCVLIYIYNAKSKDKNRIPELRRENLLIVPIATNYRPWTMGYFENVCNRPLTKDDVLSVHCFRNLFTGKYFDENNNELSKRIDPCGEYGLDSFRTIDDAISEALGIPLAPD